jgi:integrase
MLIGKPSITQTLHKTSMNHPRRERSREYLAPDEVQKLLDASRKEGLSRNRERDYCLLLLMFRHGLRVSEACRLKVSYVNVKEKIIHIQRLKNGNPTTQPMYKGEVSAVNAWMKARQQMRHTLIFSSCLNVANHSPGSQSAYLSKNTPQQQGSGTWLFTPIC